MYWSRNEGETCSASATLSKPSRASSAAASSAGSISRASRSCTAFAYSLRFRRCSARCPGSGCAAARGRAAFHPGDEAARASRVGLRAAGRRHEAAAQLAHGLLPGLGVRGMSGVMERSKAMAARPARRCGIPAVLVEELPLLLGRFRIAGRFERRRRRRLADRIPPRRGRQPCDQPDVLMCSCRIHPRPVTHRGLTVAPQALETLAVRRTRREGGPHFRIGIRSSGEPPRKPRPDPCPDSKRVARRS